MHPCNQNHRRSGTQQLNKHCALQCLQPVACGCPCLGFLYPLLPIMEMSIWLHNQQVAAGLLSQKTLGHVRRTWVDGLCMRCHWIHDETCKSFKCKSSDDNHAQPIQVPLTWLSVCFHWSAGQVACKALCQSNARTNLALPDKQRMSSSNVWQSER